MKLKILITALFMSLLGVSTGANAWTYANGFAHETSVWSGLIGFTCDLFVISDSSYGIQAAHVEVLVYGESQGTFYMLPLDNAGWSLGLAGDVVSRLRKKIAKSPATTKIIIMSGPKKGATITVANKGSAAAFRKLNCS